MPDLYYYLYTSDELILKLIILKLLHNALYLDLHLKLCLKVLIEHDCRPIKYFLKISILLFSSFLRIDLKNEKKLYFKQKPDLYPKKNENQTNKQKYCDRFFVTSISTSMKLPKRKIFFTKLISAEAQIKGACAPSVGLITLRFSLWRVCLSTYTQTGVAKEILRKGMKGESEMEKLLSVRKVLFFFFTSSFSSSFLG